MKRSNAIGGQRVSKIVDAQGQPIKVNESLQDEQTAHIGMIGREFENHPSSGLTPRILSRILSAAEHGDLTDQCDLFEDMEEKDGHIFAEMSKRKRALLGLKWDVMPPRDASAAEISAAEQLKEWILDMDDFEDHLFDMADAIGKGYSMMELDWQEQSGVMIPALIYRPARWFTIDEEVDRDQLLLRTQTGKGEALWDFGWVQHVHKSKSGYVGRSGLHRVLAWPFLFKNYSVRDLAEFLEIYGIPARLGTYPSGASDEEKMTLLRAVVSVGHNAAGIMPEGMMMEFKEAAKGASDPFKAMIDWCESIQSKAILGGTLTSTAENTGLGSNQADVHNEVRHDLLISDARQIAGTLTRDLLWPMAALNISGVDPNRKPRFKFITEEEEDITARANRDKLLFDMGFRPTEDKIKEIYGEGYERVQVENGKQDDTDNTDEAATAAAKAGDNENQLDNIDTSPVSSQVDVLSDDAGNGVKRLVDVIADKVQQATSLEALRDDLTASFNDLDDEALVNVMTMAFAAAELAGMYDVSQGE